MNNPKNTHRQQAVPPPHLSQKETRQIVTPYAFHVAPELFGTPLARPMKRGIAIGVDMLLISMISQAAGFLLAGVAAVTFFRAGNRLKLKKRFNSARLAMRFVAALLLFVFAWGLFDEFDKDDITQIGGDKIAKSIPTTGMGAIAVVGLTTKYMLKANTLHEDIATQKCQPAFDCWQAAGNEFAVKLAAVIPNASEFTDLMSAFADIADEQLTKEQRQQLLSEWQQQLEAPATETTTSTDAPAKTTDEKADKKANKKAQKSTDYSDYRQYSGLSDDDDDQPKTGVIAWTKGLMEDLGLGFGWAAFYFCIFTAWWRGQTPGKILMGIKVIKLDGSEPNLWESFGRYGGYGAGLATGLLGFLQVYWDPNRQAIQDKISETLVIDLRMPKIPFEQNSVIDEE